METTGNINDDSPAMAKQDIAASIDSVESEKTQIKDHKDLLFAAIDENKTEEVKILARQHPTLNLNCFDADGLTPLQHAVYKNNYDMCNWLIEHGADVDLTNHTHHYTPLMFAAIGGHNEIVELLLDHGADPTKTNSVRRDAAQMASFVACYKAVAIINHYVPYKYIEPYTRCQGVEDKPRLQPPALGRTVHAFVKQHNLHPVKILLRLRDSKQLLLNSKSVISVMENLMSRSIKPPINDDSFALKLHYLSWLVKNTCDCIIKSIGREAFETDSAARQKAIDSLIRRLMTRNDPSDLSLCSKRADQLIRDCVSQFPYSHLSIFQTVVYALAHQSDDFKPCALSTLNQVLKGPKGYDNSDEICAACGELCKTRKCSRCKSINYCGPECCKIHWFIHKKSCQETKTADVDDKKES